MQRTEDPKILLEGLLAEGLARVAPGTSGVDVQLERPRNPEHGDFSCNAAMQLARVLKRKPREIAQQLLESVQADIAASGAFEPLEIAGAGFINARLSPVARAAVVHRVLAEGAEFGRARTARRARVQVEFVSANPTGPLHVGHGRGAAYGASLAAVLEFAGAEVTREFYVNDAGRQMDILALSVWLRYLQARGTVVPFPEDGYRGDYVRDIAAQLTDAHVARFAREVGDARAFPVPQPGDDPDAALDAQIAAAKALLGGDWDALHHFAREAMLEDQREDLAAFRVGFDNWFSEASLYASGAVEQTVQRLAERDHLYEKDGALWFRSTQFGDEKDRVVRRENGQFTYFASDIAYHADKFARGFERVIDVWGADHHGYIPRVRGALEALGLDANRLTVALVQFAVLYRGGEKVAMGKRSGDFVTLRELREEVGNDAARFFYILRRADQHLDFDLDLAKSESQDNPVYYVQYAHARLCSVFLQWGGDAARLVDVELAPLVSARELALMRALAEFPEVVQSAAQELAPHSIAFYARELAAHFHSYYNAERILVDDEDLCTARLALCAAVRQVLANALSLLGVNAPEEM
ncbi:MAG: arginine--tRNA ligase [Betaproteobacteria bacterium SG8_39]|nr:MAG: arginine--tRNA ligase [Betaproteobacteria bacterium SG8_39]